MLNQRCSKHLSHLRGRHAWADLEHEELSLALCLAVGTQSCHVTILVSGAGRRLNETMCVQYSGSSSCKCWS